MKRIILIMLLGCITGSTGGSHYQLPVITSIASEEDTKVIGYTYYDGQFYKVKERTVKYRYLSK